MYHVYINIPASYESNNTITIRKIAKYCFPNVTELTIVMLPLAIVGAISIDLANMQEMTSKLPQYLLQTCNLFMYHVHNA